ncbi:PREDICTED: bcl-2-related ovarian killer protein-like, partial [Priapulus caudatus]|uniref:Bcl-2-related ovarian killer protein-like n=1 Tax=Priapulus caudatus TaxID=37621 RepID=A0ABM1E576_PRICU
RQLTFSLPSWAPTQEAEPTPAHKDVLGDSLGLCCDYIKQRIKRSNVPTARKAAQAALDYSGPPDVGPLVTACARDIETGHPDAYVNVCSRLGVKLNTVAALQDVYAHLAGCLLLGNELTWGKVMALFALTGALAMDCVRQQRETYIGSLMEAFTEYVSTYVCPWIIAQGGWASFARQFEQENPEDDLQAIRVGSLVGAIIICGIIVIIIIIAIL